jgi:hypothetical protein
MPDHRFKRYSISLDLNNHDRCKVLAEERATTVSGLLRLLIREAYEQHGSMAKGREEIRLDT